MSCLLDSYYCNYLTDKADVVARIVQVVHELWKAAEVIGIVQLPIRKF